MPVENDSLVNDLTQLKRRQEQTIADIERLKETADPDELADLEKIEGDVWSTILDIEEISKRRKAELTARIERNTILFKHLPRNPKAVRETCGNIRF